MSRAAREIGGDYIDFYQLEGGQIAIVIADMVGKGIPAAIVMTQMRSIMQTYVPIMSGGPLDILNTANKLILKDKLIDKFIPLFYCIFNEKLGQLVYTNAGHEPPLLYRSKTKSWETLDTDGLPIGASEFPSLEVKATPFEKEDILILYTDGAIEAKNKKGERFSIERLRTLIEKNIQLSCPELVNKLLTAIFEFSEGEKQYDDISFVIVKRAPLPPHLEKSEVLLEEKKEIRVSSDAKMVSFIRAQVGELAHQMAFCEEEIHDIKLAVNEAQANAIEHAYKEDPNQEIVIQLSAFPDRLEISVIDFGKTPNLNFFRIPENPENLEQGGLGLFLMKELMDELTFNQLPYAFTECVMVKYKRKQDDKK